MNPYLPGMIGTWQIVIIVLVVVVLFGGKRIAGLFKGVGEGLKEFKKATREDKPEQGGQDTVSKP